MEYDDCRPVDPDTMNDIRDRLYHSRCNDEPMCAKWQDFQTILDEAYELKERPDNGIVDAYHLLERTTHGPMSQYQEIRSDYLNGEYFRYRDRIATDHDHDALAQDPLGLAIERYAHGARIAEEIGDRAILAEMKLFESRGCRGSKPHRARYGRAYTTASTAFDAWKLLSNRDLAADLEVQFDLADTLALCAIDVGEYKKAYKILDSAALTLFTLRDREDCNRARCLELELFLDWDRAILYHSMGYFLLAFAHLHPLRERIDDLDRPINRVRLPRAIAEIALDYAEIIESSDRMSYSRPRLLSLADTETRRALNNIHAVDDRLGFAMTRLTQARWSGMAKFDSVTVRTRFIDEARSIAEERNNVALEARVDIALGDDHAIEQKFAKARTYYKTAEERMRAIGYVDMANSARRRLGRLPSRRKSAPPYKPSPN